MGRRTTSVKALDGDKLLRRRIAAGLSQGDLAALAGCSDAYVSMLETKAREAPSAPQMRKFAAALGCKITDLMPDEPAMNGHGAA